MSCSSPKNNTERLYKNKSRPKSNKAIIKKETNLSSYEYCKKLYQKFFTNPNSLLLIQIKQENLNLALSNLSLTDILIINEIFKKYFYFKQIDIIPYASIKSEYSNVKKHKTKQENIRENKEKQEKLKIINNIKF